MLVSAACLAEDSFKESNCQGVDIPDLKNGYSGGGTLEEVERGHARRLIIKYVM